MNRPPDPHHQCLFDSNYPKKVAALLAVLGLGAKVISTAVLHTTTSALRLKGNPSEVEPGSDPKGETSSPASPQDLLKAKIHREGNREFALSLFHYVQQMKYTQGTVLPLFDGIAHLEMSLRLELRLLDVNLPVETPQCGDLISEYVPMIDSRDLLVRIYDVCAQAAKAMNLFDSDARLFCVDVKYCHRLFQGFNIKILAMVFSQFAEVIMVDVDMLFFQSPTRLWSLSKYISTQRTTAILASFVAKNGIPLPSPYGDKECYFIACELAEIQYAFSDSGARSLGTDMRDDGGEIPNSILCEASVLHCVLVSYAAAVPSNVTSSG